MTVSDDPCDTRHKLLVDCGKSSGLGIEASGILGCVCIVMHMHIEGSCI